MGCEKTEKEVEAPPIEENTYMIHLPKPLNIEEKKYLLAVERGDLVNVKRFIQYANKSHVSPLKIHFFPLFEIYHTSSSPIIHFFLLSG